MIPKSRSQLNTASVLTTLPPGTKNTVRFPLCVVNSALGLAIVNRVAPKRNGKGRGRVRASKVMGRISASAPCMTHLAIHPGQSALMDYAELDAAVAEAPFVGVVASGRLGITEPLGHQHRAVHTLFDQVIAYRIGSFL